MGPQGLQQSAGSINGQFDATLCPSKGQWYQHFETGICAQMGDGVPHNQAYTIEVILVLLEMFEEQWQMFIFESHFSLSVHACSCLCLLLVE
jgi:hypothetical protein